MQMERNSTTQDRLREALDKVGMKQAELSKITGIDKGAISSYLSGKYEPKQEAIYKMAVALGVSEMWLWGYDVSAERTKAQKNNDAIAGIVVKLRTDEDFLNAVKRLYDFDSDKLKSFLGLTD